MNEQKLRVQVMVELTPREERALGHWLGRKVILRADVKKWGLALVRARVAELVDAHYACECKRAFPDKPRGF